MNVETIIKAAIPSATEGDIDYIMWGRTPYPMGKLSAKTIYKAASRTRRAYDNGVNLCDLCDNIAMEEDTTCKKCHDRLESIRLSRETP